MNDPKNHPLCPDSGRFSNGLILSDYLSQMLGLSSFSTPFLEPNASCYYGCNFDFSASGAVPADDHHGPLPDQVSRCVTNVLSFFICSV